MNKKNERVRRLPSRQAKDPETGRKVCRHWDCDKVVEPPRRSWCGAECVHDAMMQIRPSYAREQVKNRDKGICQACGRDCQAIRDKIRILKSITTYARFEKKVARRFELKAHKIRAFMSRAEKFYRGFLKGYERRLSAEGFDRGRKNFWDMDHIIEVVRGGSYKIENLTTLCQPCHKAKTARLAAERALERRGEKLLPEFKA